MLEEAASEVKGQYSVRERRLRGDASELDEHGRMITELWLQIGQFKEKLLSTYVAQSNDDRADFEARLRSQARAFRRGRRCAVPRSDHHCSPSQHKDASMAQIEREVEKDLVGLKNFLIKQKEEALRANR